MPPTNKVPGPWPSPPLPPWTPSQPWARNRTPVAFPLVYWRDIAISSDLPPGIYGVDAPYPRTEGWYLWFDKPQEHIFRLEIISSRLPAGVLISHVSIIVNGETFPMEYKGEWAGSQCWAYTSKDRCKQYYDYRFILKCHIGSRHFEMNYPTRGSFHTYVSEWGKPSWFTLYEGPKTGNAELSFSIEPYHMVEQICIQNLEKGAEVEVQYGITPDVREEAYIQQNYPWFGPAFDFWPYAISTGSWPQGTWPVLKCGEYILGSILYSPRPTPEHNLQGYGYNRAVLTLSMKSELLKLECQLSLVGWNEPSSG